MSYGKKIELTIVPDECFGIIKNCQGCGRKTVYRSTDSFRVNANGNKLDVWLIYQCTKCKHTCNLTVRERIKPESILKLEYEGYLDNSSELSFKYGTDQHFFARNKAEIDWSGIKYKIAGNSSETDPAGHGFHRGDTLIVRNSYSLKIRTDKVVSDLLKVTRSELKKLKESGTIIVTEDKQNHKIVVRIEGGF